MNNLIYIFAKRRYIVSVWSPALWQTAQEVQHLTRDSGGLRIRIPVWSIVIFPINIPLLLVQWTDRLFPAQGWWSFRVRITWEGRNVIVRIFQHCMVAETCTCSSFGRAPDQQFCGRGFKSRSGLSLYLPFYIKGVWISLINAL